MSSKQSAEGCESLTDRIANPYVWLALAWGAGGLSILIKHNPKPPDDPFIGLPYAVLLVGVMGAVTLPPIFAIEYILTYGTYKAGSELMEGLPGKHQIDEERLAEARKRFPDESWKELYEDDP